MATFVAPIRRPASASRASAPQAGSEPSRAAAPAEDLEARFGTRETPQQLIDRVMSASPLGLPVSKPTDPTEREAGVGDLEREAEVVAAQIAATVSPTPGGEGFRIPDGAVRAAETVTGTSLGSVRIRRDAFAAEAKQSRAFARGDEIVFGAGQYAPETRAGLGLIGHELAHVAQERSGRAPVGEALRAPREPAFEPQVSIEEGVPPTLVFDRPVDADEAKRILFETPPPGLAVEPAPGEPAGARQTRWRATFGTSENVFRMRDNLGPRYVQAGVIRAKGPPPPPLVEQLPKWLPPDARGAIARGFTQGNQKQGVQTFGGPAPWGNLVVWSGKQQEFVTTDPQKGLGKVVTGSADVVEIYLEYPTDLDFYLPFVGGSRSKARLLQETYAQWNLDMRRMVVEGGMAPSAAREKLNVINTAIFTQFLEAVSKVFLVGSGIKAASSGGGRGVPSAPRAPARGAPTSGASADIDTAVSTGAKQEAEAAAAQEAKVAERAGAPVPTPGGPRPPTTSAAEETTAGRSQPVALTGRPSLASVPGIRGGAFAKWFNELTADELDQVWQNTDLRDAVEARLREPRGMHEWLLVSKANVFKRWGVTAEQVAELRTPTGDVQFLPRGRHGMLGSTTAHNELARLIDASSSLADYARRLREWAKDRLLGGVDALPRGFRD